MKITALTAALVGAMMVGGASAVRLTRYGDSDTTCSGAVTATNDFSNGKCKSVEGGSGLIACVSAEAGSTWIFNAYSGSGCSTAVGDSTAGTGNTACVLADSIGEYIKVDCSLGSCFSGSSFVVLPGDKKVHLSEVNVGDEILSADAQGNLFFDRVFRITHYEPSARDDLFRVTTADGTSVDLTGEHYMHVGSLDLDDLTLAKDVKVGDTLFTVADGQTTTSAVASVEQVPAEGLFNVHTTTGRMVVNGVVSTHFTSDSKWTQKSMATYWYKAVDLVSGIFGTTDAKAEALQQA